MDAPIPPPHRRARLTTAAVAILVLAALSLSGAGAASAAGGGGGGGGAAATVGNGLSTTDLSAVGMSPATLASNLVGSGVSVSNVSFTGANAQAGLIHLVDPAVVSFNDGIIMSSGDIADVVGPNKSDGITGDMAGGPDADLNALIADTQTVYPATFDAATLEFDFVPQADHVYFTYTWGSDEYLEWVNLFNDVFAFYVNGQNCATVPDGHPVSIDTINDAVNPDLFRDNSYSSPPANPINIESDGLSVEMICSAPVTPGATNHMKLAIADTSDQILDSVVMIKAHSLSTTPPEACNDHADNDGDDLIDDADDSCSSTTTPPPPGQEGIGSDSKAPPFTGNEGTPIPLDASALGWTADPEAISTTWTVTGINGTPGSCTIEPSTPQPIGPGGAIAVVDAICPNEGEYVASVDGMDAEGSSAFDEDVDFFVHNAPPEVSLSSPTNGAQATVGTPVEVVADVTDPGPGDTTTCSISWGDGTSDEGDLADGVCTGSHVYADPAQVVVSVTGADDAGDSSAAAALIDVTDTAVTVTSSANPSVRGQQVSLTATTTLGTTGTMAFYDGETLLGNRTVKGGSATFTSTRLTVGTHTITAAYRRVSTDPPSSSEPLDQVVDPAETTTTVTSSADPSVAGQAVRLTVAVSPQAPGGGTPSGPVELYDDGVLVGTRQLSSGRTTFTVRPSVGAHHYTADYLGSTEHLGSTSEPVDQQVDPAATTTTVTGTPPTAVSGQGVRVRVAVAAVAPGGWTPTGTVDLYDGSTLLATRTLSGGATTVTVRPTVGPHEYTATYSGSATHLPSATSAPATVAVGQASTTTTLTGPPSPTAPGQSVSLRTVVRSVAPGSGIPTGQIELYDGDTLVATRTLGNGAATVTLTPAPGSHTYRAVYLGSTSHLLSATTTDLVHVVGAA